MAAGRHQDHVPAAVIRGRLGERGETEEDESGRESDGAHTIGDHGNPYICVAMLVNRAVPELGMLHELVDQGNTVEISSAA
jgi:hypothetical protein